MAENGNDTMQILGGIAISIFGGADNDLLRVDGGTGGLAAGNSGNDVIVGNGTDPALLFGGTGNDVLSTSGIAGDILVGEEGDDGYQIAMPTTSGITLSLDEVRKLGDDEPFRDSYGLGTDILDFRSFTVGITLDLSRVAGKVATSADLQQIAPGINLVLFGIFDTVYGTHSRTPSPETTPTISSTASAATTRSAAAPATILSPAARAATRWSAAPAQIATSSPMPQRVQRRFPNRPLMPAPTRWTSPR